MSQKKKRTFFKNTELYHYYYIKSGFYKALFFNVLKMSVGVAVVIVAFVLVTEYMLDFEERFQRLVEVVPPWVVYGVFFFSDSVLLSIVPPDLFIIWAESFEYKYLALLCLGTISWCAGIFSFFIGKRLRKMPFINRWLLKRFSGLIRSVNKWGTAFIIIAALLPIPWSPALIVAGLMNYPQKRMLLVTLTRYVRIFLYGIVLYNVIDIF
jgi:hypothetical protein